MQCYIKLKKKQSHNTEVAEGGGPKHILACVKNMYWRQIQRQSLFKMIIFYGYILEGYKVIKL